MPGGLRISNCGTGGWGRGERMDKSVLAECSAMKEEIKDIRRRIEKDRKELDRLNRMVVSDSVACGKKGKKPLRTVKIQGRPETMIRRKEAALKRNIARLEHLEIELIELTGQAEEFIEKIDKSELRTMFRLYYIDDLTWEMVAMRMNHMFPKRRISYTKDSCRIRHDRFLEKVS